MNTKVITAARILLGLIYFVFGLNFFFQLIPVSPPESETAKNFMAGLFQAGYFFPFMKTIEITAGAMLLVNFYTPLALLLLAPITLNIVLYHRILAGGPPMDLVMVATSLVLAWSYRKVYAPIFVKQS